MKVVQSWLGYRKAERKGNRSSPLDDIAPERWTFLDELLTLLSVVERKLSLTQKGHRGHEAVVAGPLVGVGTLSKPTESERSS